MDFSPLRVDFLTHYYIEFHCDLTVISHGDFDVLSGVVTLGSARSLMDKLQLMAC